MVGKACKPTTSCFRPEPSNRSERLKIHEGIHLVHAEAQDLSRAKTGGLEILEAANP